MDTLQPCFATMRPTVGQDRTDSVGLSLHQPARERDTISPQTRMNAARASSDTPFLSRTTRTTKRIRLVETTCLLCPPLLPPLPPALLFPSRPLRQHSVPRTMVQAAYERLCIPPHAVCRVSVMASRPTVHLGSPPPRLHRSRRTTIPTRLHHPACLVGTDRIMIGKSHRPHCMALMRCSSTGRCTGFEIAVRRS